MDPCAGEGVAILEFGKGICGGKISDSQIKLFAVEMEQSRYEALKSNLGWSIAKHALEGDAFRVDMCREDDQPGVSCLYLNPPYDTDRVHGRLEQKFLSRFTSAVTFGGYLVFVVPYYALSASAAFLAQEYDQIECYRFPDGDFEVFKQVVLVARRGVTLFEPHQQLEAKIRAWATDPSGMPILGTRQGLYSLPVFSQYKDNLDWTMRPIDTTAILAKIRPWMQTTRTGVAIPVPGIIPSTPVQDLLLRRYPVATPPRPAHIAAGIASGIFNGARVEPNDPGTKLPPLLVKGVFDKEYRTISEKQDKNGVVVSETQIQQPKLVTTVLDLSTYTYHTLKTGKAGTGSLQVEAMGVVDLLTNYGQSLMSVMETQCPILYDPRRDANDITLPESPRKLFSAQAHAAKALVKLLGVRKKGGRGKAAILLGEIGSGKSTVSLMTAKTVNSRRPLVLCPPHLLTSWTNEVQAVFPDAEVRVLSSVEDVDNVAADSREKMIVSVLSRETAKLGHGWSSVGDTCPRCGVKTPASVDFAKKRTRCEAQKIIPKGDLANEVVSFAYRLFPFAPNNQKVTNFLRGRFDAVRSVRQTPKTFTGLPVNTLDNVLDLLLAQEGTTGSQPYERAILTILMAINDTAKTAEVAARFLDREEKYTYQSFSASIAMLLPPNSPEQQALLEEGLKKFDSPYTSWRSFSNRLQSIQGLKKEVGYGDNSILGHTISWADGKLLYNDVEAGTLDAALVALGAVAQLARFGLTEECGEFLFQAVPEPRRIALAKYITRHHPGAFDFLVLDEGHEYGNDSSAQGFAAHRLSGLGLPTVLMTGSIMNGYAESLFANMWALSPDFRAEFERDEKQRFIDRYGYRKRVVECKDKDSGEVVAFGSVTDRVERSERVTGNAPGILPLFLLRHLLPFSVTLHKADLAIDLPLCRHQRHTITPDADVLSNFKALQSALIQRIRKDQFDPEFAGKLFGQLAELPSYLDRSTCDTGNTEEGDFEISYPESVGGALVASAKGFPADRLMAKEEWLLDLVERELAEGRNVMVFSWHVSVLPRLSRIISERIGEPVPILYADKVPTAKRQDWIDREIVRKGRRVMVANPVCVQTGLNNLVHFATEIWAENPACNPITYRQAIGRVDRIGQKQETRIHFPVYADTLQVQLYDLLMNKVAVSVSTDGLDPESALQAAGIGEDEYLTGLSIGKQLWAMLQ
jgi:hypothetical protein